MKTLRLIFLLLLPSSAFANEFADNYGIGILDINTSKNNTSVSFHFSKSIVGMYFNIRFDTVMKAECTDYKFTILIDDSNYFAPEVFHKSEGCNPYKLQFFCLEKKDGWYKVRMNNKKRTYAWLLTDCEAKIIPFIDFYKQMCSVEVNSDSDNVFLEKPNKKAKVVYSISSYSSFNEPKFSLKPLQIKSDWMEVQIEFPYKTKPTKQLKGWIKWRNDKKPL